MPHRIRTIADIVPVNAGRYGSRTAVQWLKGDGIRSVTYRQLGWLVRNFRDVLLDSGVRRGDKVGLFMPNGLKWIVSYLAAIQAGGVVVPIIYESPTGSYAEEVVRYIANHAELRLLVTLPEEEKVVGNLLADASITLVPCNLVMEPNQDARRATIQPDAPAQILYTSGTTGRKKGVVLTHRNILENVRGCVDRFDIRGDDCLPALLPYAHAYALTASVIAPLYTGTRIAAGNVRSSGTGELLRRVRPTILIGVPRMYEALLARVERVAKREGKLTALRRAEEVTGMVKDWTGLNVGRVLFRSLHRQLFGGSQLRFCVSGGAKLGRDTALRFLKLGIPLLQGWGLTELSPVCTVQKYSPWRFYFTSYYEKRIESIGKPLKDVKIHLRDVPQKGIYLDVAGKGEMVVDGPNVMKEYYKHPEETRRRKSPDGFITGDIARRGVGGEYYIEGRAKHVIVLPGAKKVFPEDLEAELQRCRHVEEHVVRAIEDEDGREKVGIIIRPDIETVREDGIATMKELYSTLKREIDDALADKPACMRRYDFCLSAFKGDGFQELVKNALGEPCPLKNEFVHKRAWSAGAGDETSTAGAAVLVCL